MVKVNTTTRCREEGTGRGNKLQPVYKTYKLGHWNVQTLYQEGKLKQVVIEMQEIGISYYTNEDTVALIYKPT